VEENGKGRENIFNKTLRKYVGGTWGLLSIHDEQRYKGRNKVAEAYYYFFLRNILIQP